MREKAVGWRMERSDPRFVYRASRMKSSVKAGLRAVRLMRVPIGSLVRPVLVSDVKCRWELRWRWRYPRGEASLCGLASCGTDVVQESSGSILYGGMWELEMRLFQDCGWMMNVRERRGMSK